MYNDTKQDITDIDLNNYVTELKTPWKTMGPDMDTAQTIIIRHARTELDLSVMELMSISDDANEIKISFPDWQAEVENTFINQYGLHSGRQIFKKVVMRLYLLSRGTAQYLQ